MQGKICPYCKKETEFIDSVKIYGKSYGMVYYCADCKAWVGVHKDTGKALGRLANDKLREAKKAAHAAFDPIWKQKIMTRSAAYQWLADQLSLPANYTHIGMFKADTCEKVVRVCSNFFKQHKTKSMDLKILFLDVETNGKPINWNASYEDLDNWPRITQLAWIVADATGKMLTGHQLMIKPDGWEIPKEEFFINNNMSTERCELEGIPIKSALEFLMLDIANCDVLVAHNLSFDHRTTWSEIIRAGMEPKKGMIKICTMLKSTKHCNLPNPKGKGPAKWPTLEELHTKLFDKPFDGMHDAGGDVAAVYKCFFELVKLNVVELPTVGVPA